MGKANYVIRKEKFDNMLAKGAKGEQVIIERLRKITEVKDLTDYSTFRKYQRKGLDFQFKSLKDKGVWLRGDSKANIMGGTQDNLGVTFFEIYKGTGKEGWFKTSKSDYIFIYDAKMGRSYFYDLDQMRKHINKLPDFDRRLKQVSDGAYGIWWPVAHPLIKELQ
jgi:hypothetical protein